MSNIDSFVRSVLQSVILRAFSNPSCVKLILSDRVPAILLLSLPAVFSLISPVRSPALHARSTVASMVASPLPSLLSTLNHFGTSIFHEPLVFTLIVNVPPFQATFSKSFCGIVLVTSVFSNSHGS